MLSVKRPTRRDVVERLRRAVHRVARGGERQQRLQPRLRRLRHRRHRQPDRLGGVADQHAGAAADGDHAERVARPGRCAGSRSCAMSSISSVVRARTTPNSRSTASVTASSPAIDAVWLRAASAPTRRRADLHHHHRLPAPGAPHRGRRGSCPPRGCPRHRRRSRRCPGSSAIQPMTSPMVTSPSLPVVTQIGVPMPRLRAMANTWVP